MTKIEIGLRTVVGDKHFAVLKRRHCPWINVQVGIALLEGDAEAAAFQQTAHGSCCNAFSEGRNHAARNKDVFRAAGQGARIPPLESAYNALWREKEHGAIFKTKMILRTINRSSPLRPCEFGPATSQRGRHRTGHPR